MDAAGLAGAASAIALAATAGILGSRARRAPGPAVPAPDPAAQTALPDYQPASDGDLVIRRSGDGRILSVNAAVAAILGDPPRRGWAARSRNSPPG